MRILILGAGGTGGYFGGRLAQAGVDVTFLVREARAAQLQADGLRIRSPLGDADLQVAHVTAQDLSALVAQQPFDLVILSCKAYDLDSAIEAIAPAVGEHTTVLPILNGLRHYPALDERFGATRVLGGLCFISATKGEHGEILHLGKPAAMTFGERDGSAASARVQAFAAACAQAGIDHVASEQIALEQWIKYSFLTALAAATCLMRAPVGAIVVTDDGRALINGLYNECLWAADAAGHSIPEPARAKALQTLLQVDSPLKASMLRDLEAGQDVEAAQIVGDMLARVRETGRNAPLMMAANVHLQTYQVLRHS
ncbi:2-dehydropantoate 2-reductase [Xanthomonas vasicola]|uniref:2-dehydropantoate 2-reductase n=1 Tax=Xanthomonas vasicola TaxID=56459 RepID=A0ABD7SDV3_XANVA|nr:2-dehydropantoate 2-reductase [Xanthomonas vasicola]AZR24446.1 2-dehydropantoate 2-reductase [Xanthomonas vasicola]KGR38474.1 2-dehydropantoate 2-reductase [Xanthomonas vasicola]KGR39098.1 2-dehydropantoate 2-reductase [Xanthomonas vasicola]KGR59292.1 2-dehydropantoate 2-reductase [Xanthomonas vasicola]MDO6984984.1 2-dehydropantoate 2-reductase [Xanthomonas vasicola]